MRFSGTPRHSQLGIETPNIQQTLPTRRREADQSILTGVADDGKKRLLIVRHAESSANSKGILAGRIDPTPLTNRGKSEAKAIREVVAHFSPQITISSPMLRCRETAKAAGIGSFEIDDRLLEMDYGRWSGKSLKTLSRTPLWRRIQQKPSSVTFPGGESFIGAQERIRNFLIEITSRPVERVAIFSHGDIVRMAINILLGRRDDEFQRIMIETASHSLLSYSLNPLTSEFETTVHYLNRRESLRLDKRIGFKVGGE